MSPYWENVYRNAPENVKEYYNLCFAGGEFQTEDVTRQCSEKRNSFTKSDWEYLISVSSGRAKFEYTKMMNTVKDKKYK